MSKELTDITSSFFNDISIKLIDLLENFNEFTLKNDRLIQVYQVLTRIIQLECYAVTKSQYSKRESIKIDTVPAHIHEDVLEEHVCKALLLTGVNVVACDLHAYHRMKR